VFLQLFTANLSFAILKKYIMAITKGRTEKFALAILNLSTAFRDQWDELCQVVAPINEKELKVIIYLAKNQPSKMSDLAEALSAPLSTLTSIVDKLVETKYLVRGISPQDRLIVLITLADKGEKIYKIHVTEATKFTQNVLGRFAENEQADVIDVINRLAGAMNNKK
jgi:DNA-binding MarR family transcriptional regulator